MKAIVDYKTLQDGSIVAVCANQQATVVSAEAVQKYMDDIMNVTNAPEVEFNKTFEQCVGGRVFYAFQRSVNSIPADVFKVVVLDDNSLAAKLPGHDCISIIVPEDEDHVFATEADAMEASRQHTLCVINAQLDNLVETRKQLKDEIREVNSNIDSLIAARHRING